MMQVGVSLCRTRQMSTRDFFAVYFGPHDWRWLPKVNVLRTRFRSNRVFGIEVRLFQLRASIIIHTDRQADEQASAEERATHRQNGEDFSAAWRDASGEGA